MSTATAKPALLTEVNPGVIATLQKAIIKAKSGTLVTLADTVFTKRSELLLSHANSKDSNGMSIMGAHNIKPEKFFYKKLASNVCFIILKQIRLLNLKT